MPHDSCFSNLQKMSPSRDNSLGRATWGQFRDKMISHRPASDGHTKVVVVPRGDWAFAEIERSIFGVAIQPLREHFESPTRLRLRL